MKMKNLFDFATKELSQDAFLRWLFENWDCESKDVRNAARELLIEFDVINQSDKIKNLWTWSQKGKIDIDVYVELESGNNVALFIEDKTNSYEHNQLLKYNDYIDSFDKKWELKFNKKVKIYYKTSPISEDERERVVEANWREYSFDNINKFWEKYINSSNLILNDYANHVVRIYKNYNNKDKPTEDDLPKWLSYFGKNVKSFFDENYKQFNSWTNNYQNRYAYICFRLADFDFPGSPYIELRSRDCTNNNFIARILTNGLDEIEKNHLTCEQCALIRKEIRDYLRNNKTVFKVNNGEKNNKQLGINKETNNNIETNEVFINKLEETLKDFEDIIRSLSLYPRN